MINSGRRAFGFFAEERLGGSNGGTILETTDLGPTMAFSKEGIMLC
jgi:hypothetical protein